uniref:Uncharacterized protein n=1 Tax=Chenopodium quinoa TaxID=63459 RepID=A0A803MX68_CHEQI
MGISKKPVKYAVIDAFTDSEFKGNPAAVELCGHATLAAAHFCFTSGLVKENTVEFSTLSGILTAQKVIEPKESASLMSDKVEVEQRFLIELDFPAITTSECNLNETSFISKVLSPASVIDMKKTASDDLFVVLPSAKAVTDIQVDLEEIKKCPGRGLIICAAAPSESGFDFISRFFCPKYGIDEDPVCGSAHCALAYYWSKKMGKSDFTAYAASSRSGVVKLHIDEQKNRVKLRGNAVTVNAFTDSEFKGDPAAVCLLEEERESEWLQSIAAEFNISETSYLIPLPVSDSSHPRFHLRWFTPVTEICTTIFAKMSSSNPNDASLFSYENLPKEEQKDDLAPGATRSGDKNLKKGVEVIDLVGEVAREASGKVVVAGSNADGPIESLATVEVTVVASKVVNSKQQKKGSLAGMKRAKSGLPVDLENVDEGYLAFLRESHPEWFADK